MYRKPWGESQWGTINNSLEICFNIFRIIARDEHGMEHVGIMVGKDKAQEVLSPKAIEMGKVRGEWICYDENTMIIPLYEALQHQRVQCKQLEYCIIQNMDEIRREGKLHLTDYFGEFEPPELSLTKNAEGVIYVRNGIYIICRKVKWKIAVHESIADHYMTSMAIEFGMRKGDYLFFNRKTSAIVLNELRCAFKEIAEMIISVDSLNATLYKNFSQYTAAYNKSVPQQKQIRKVQAPANQFIAMQMKGWQ